MGKQKTKCEITYKVDRNLLVLFDCVSMINNYFNLPKKYKDILINLEIDLANEIFEKPSKQINGDIIKEVLTITDYYEIKK